ncbi:MAG: hypothetical protein V4494_07335 [Chlamydiota bacterium]
MLYQEQEEKIISHKTTRLTIDLPASEHKRLKMAVSLIEISMKQPVIMSVDDFMQKKPNKVTEKALKQ